MSRLAKEIETWIKNEVRVGQYINGMDLLKQSGVFELLRRLGVPNMTGSTESMAIQGAHANGYQTCLEHLHYIIQIFEEKKDTGKATVSPDFGGEKAAIAKGDLRDGDLDKV